MPPITAEKSYTVQQEDNTKSTILNSSTLSSQGIYKPLLTSAMTYPTKASVSVISTTGADIEETNFSTVATTTTAQMGSTTTLNTIVEAEQKSPDKVLKESVKESNESSPKNKKKVKAERKETSDIAELLRRELILKISQMESSSLNSDAKIQ